MYYILKIIFLITIIATLSACGQIATESNRGLYQNDSTSTDPNLDPVPEPGQDPGAASAEFGRCVVEEMRLVNFRFSNFQTYCLDFKAEININDVDSFRQEVRDHCEMDLDGVFEVSESCEDTSPVSDLIDSMDTELIMENTCMDERTLAGVTLMVDHYTTDNRYELEKDPLCERVRD